MADNKQPPVPRDAARSEEPEQIVYLNISELHAFKLRQRTEILPTEKAQSLKMQVEAIKHQGGPAMGDADPKDAGKRSTQVVGDRNNMNYKQVQRYNGADFLRLI